ncbi:MAG: cell division protein SepF [Corynebacterium sp.]|nr:cell division protein SepF [Corynebacterium sp.]
MSFLVKTKEFFGLTESGLVHDDPYYNDEPRYDTHGSAAYAPRTSAYAHAVAEPEFEPTIVAVSVHSFNQAKQIGEAFRDGDAVVFEVTDADFAIAKRLIDFAAGLCLGLSGRMLNLTRDLDTDRKVFAIVPEQMSVPTIELENAAGLN